MSPLSSEPPVKARMLRFLALKTTLPSDTTKQATDDGLALVLSSAKLLSDVCRAAPFPYIASAAGALVTLIECVQVVRKNNDDYHELINRIRWLMELLKEELEEHPQIINARYEQVCREFCE